jgi:uncharacterized protein YndB with AHSA1/START domain
MPDILLDFPVAAPPATVFAVISTPGGLDQWWTLTSAGEPREGAAYTLGFGPEYQWTARVTQCQADQEFELELVSAMPDWTGTRVGFHLAATPSGTTRVQFRHTGWAHAGDHFRTSTFCWAMYLRILKLGVEQGLSVPYEQRLAV